MPGGRWYGDWALMPLDNKDLIQMGLKRGYPRGGPEGKA